MVTVRMAPQYDEIVRVLRDVVAPLVEADGGSIYLISADESRVTVHLAGQLSGAPGNGLLCRKILEPAIHAVAPGAEVVLSTGWMLPAEAVLIQRQ